MANKYESLKLESQLCFPLYACAKELVNNYKPYLIDLDLTYTQYITMMVMWEKERVSVKELGKRLHLDSGTLTPVLKTLEKKGYVSRARSKEDERVLIVTLTAEGTKLKDKALEVPREIEKSIELTHEETFELYTLLKKMLATFDQPY